MAEPKYQATLEKDITRQVDVPDKDFPETVTEHLVLTPVGTSHYILGCLEVAIKEGWTLTSVKVYREWNNAD